MSNSFRVGDLVILQHPTYYHEYDGVPAVIVGEHAERQALDMRSMKWEFAWTWSVRMLKRTNCLDTSETVLVHTWQMRKPGTDEEKSISHVRRDLEVKSC